MNVILWILLAPVLVIIVAGIALAIAFATDLDSCLYRKYTTGDEFLDPYGNPKPVKWAKNGQ